MADPADPTQDDEKKPPSDLESISALRLQIETMAAEIAAFRDAARVGSTEIKNARDAASQNAVEAQQFRAKADSEALAAYAAKEQIENHFRDIASKKGDAEVAVGAINTAKKNAEENSAFITTTKASAESDKAAILEIKNRIDSQVAEIDKFKTRSEAGLTDITAKTKEVEDIRKKAASLLDSSTKLQESSEAKLSTIATSETEVLRLAGAVSESATGVANSKNAIQQVQGDCEKQLESITATVELVKTTDSKVKQFEREIAKHNTDIADLIRTIEGILPGAASASLASAFKTQKERFKEPQARWMSVFKWSIILLMIVAGAGVVQTMISSDDTWDATWRHLVQRLPLLAPLVWLAVLSSHHYFLSLRLEEDYAFKEALSIAFEGYKREMSLIKDENTERLSPLLKLCQDILAALSERPGRIYDGKHQHVTPLSALSDTLEKLLADRKSKPAVGGSISSADASAKAGS